MERMAAGRGHPGAAAVSIEKGRGEDPAAFAVYTQKSRSYLLKGALIEGTAKLLPFVR